MQLASVAWPVVEALSKDTPVVIPVAALEQHGAHLPLFTDSLLLGEIVRRAALEVPRQVVWTPLLWLGNSDHNLDFPGTASAAPRVYLDVLNGLAENFIQHGFRRIVFLNATGGNEAPGRQAIFEVRQRHRKRADLLLLFANYWSLGDHPGTAAPAIEQREMGHACEWETSMMLRLNDRLVGDILRLRTIDARNPFDSAARAWITKDRSPRGYIGSPQFANAEKGEALLTTFTRDVVEFLGKAIRWDGKTWND